MTFFKSKSGKSSRKNSLKENNGVKKDNTPHNNSNEINNIQNSVKPIVPGESILEETNELSSIVEENLNNNNNNNNKVVHNIPSHSHNSLSRNQPHGTNSNSFSNIKCYGSGPEIYREVIEGEIKNISSATSIDTNLSKNTHGTGNINCISNSSVNENEENITSENSPNRINTHHKRNSIFSGFSKIRRKSKTVVEEKKYKSAPHLENNPKLGKSNSLKVVLNNNNNNTENNDPRMKRYMSVPDNKIHNPRRISLSRKKKNSEVNINSSPVNSMKSPFAASCNIPVKETNTMVRDYDPKTGRKMINNYVVVKEVGRGCHGKVKLCYDIDTNEQYAMKIVNKKLRRRFYYRMALSQQQDAVNPHIEKIKREIAILKKCSHPHVVRLKEVIDSPESEKIYIILEYLDGGEVKWQVSPEEPKPVMTQDVARRVFRDVISGVGYLHHQGIVHRDIKPANLLWTSDGHVKISDFGVSCFMNTDNPNLSSKERRMNELELAKTAGSPAFFAPELCGINDDEISNTITQFAALLNSRASNKSQNAFPRTPSNISSFSKLDAIFAPRSIHTPSIMSRMSDGSLSKNNNESKSYISQDDKNSQMDESSIINNNSSIGNNIQIPNDKSSYSSLQQQPLNNSNDKLEVIHINDKSSSLSLNNSELGNKSPNNKPRSIKFVQYKSKRSLSLSESASTNINVNGSIINKSSLDDRLSLTNNLLLNKNYKNRINISNSSSINSSNESLNIRKKIFDASKHNSFIISNNNNSIDNNEQKVGYSSSYSTLDSKLKTDTNLKHNLKESSKSSLSINIDASNDATDNTRVNSGILNNINSCNSPVDYEKTIPPDSPLFVRRRCSQSSSRSNRISRSQSSLSSSKSKLQNSNEKINVVNGDNKSSKSVLNGKRSGSSSIKSNNNNNQVEGDKDEKEGQITKKTPHIDGKLIDIWAMGVTLYCLVFGDVPFTASTEFELLSVICHQELKFPADIPISDSLRDLLTKILTKDPKQRIGMKGIENHPWVTEDLSKEEREEWLKFVSLNDDPLDVTEDEVKKALTIKERIKRGFSKFTHSLNFFSDEFRRRTKSMPSVKVTDKDLLKNKKNSTINEGDEEQINTNKGIGIIGRSNTTNNEYYGNNRNLNNPRINSKALNHSNNLNNNIDNNKDFEQLDSSLNEKSCNNSSPVSNNINVISGLSHKTINNINESDETNVRSSQIYTIPKTFLNKDLKEEPDSDDNEDEADINEDSSGEILFMSFDRKSKKKNTRDELNKLIKNDDKDSNNNEDNDSSQEDLEEESPPTNKKFLI